MNEKNPKQAGSSRPWWLHGSEKCGFCLQGFVLETETRCIECDRPYCPMCCAEGATSHHRCPSCGEREAPE